LVGHLDLMRLFDRAIRRAALPIAFSGGFHPAPRIMAANALSLGYTSNGEIIEFELREQMELGEFQQRLTAQLNDNLPIYSIAEMPLSQPVATQVLERAEYRLKIQAETEVDWLSSIGAVLAATEIMQTQTTKSGKEREVNLRERLFELELLNVEAQSVEIRYIGSCRNDGTMLRPEQMMFMLSQMAGISLELSCAVRLRLICEA
jgi:radical SAM-linked protein